MKLRFYKDDQQNLIVKITENQIEKDFSYVDMIKSLSVKNKFEPSEFSADVSEEEQIKINTMLATINNKITEDQDEK